MKKLLLIALTAMLFAGCEKEPSKELHKITIYSFNVYADSYADIMGYDLIINGVKKTHTCRGEYTTHYQSLDEPIYIYGKSFANHPTPTIYLSVFVDDIGAFSLQGNPINYNGPIYFEN